MINYNGKIFKPIVNTDNGETSHETVFIYKQTGNILTSECGCPQFLDRSLRCKRLTIFTFKTVQNDKETS